MMGASLTGLPGGPHTLKQETSYFEIVNTVYVKKNLKVGKI